MSGLAATFPKFDLDVEWEPAQADGFGRTRFRQHRLQSMSGAMKSKLLEGDVEQRAVRLAQN